MDFEKKYWSKEEFTTFDGSNYEGYVGISDGKAYIFETEELLYPSDTYTCRINCSSEHYDRTLSHELKLPYDKTDIVFAANDFLYNTTLKTAVERLEANNNYIFRNSIISNSNIPNAEVCTMIASNGAGELQLFDFAKKAFDNLTTSDRTFYEDTEYKSDYTDKDILGQKNNILSENTIFIDTPPERLASKKYGETDEQITNITARELYDKFYGCDEYERGRFSTFNKFNEFITRYKAAISEKPLESNVYKNTLKIENNNYFFNHIGGEIEYSYKIKEEPVDTNTEVTSEYDINLMLDSRVAHIYDFDAKHPVSATNLQLMINELYFIIHCEDIENISLKYAVKNSSATGEVSFTPISTDKNSIEYYSLTNKDHYLVKVIPSDMVIKHPNDTITLKVNSALPHAVVCEKPIETNIRNIQFSLNYNVGYSNDNSINLLKYKLLPKINKTLSYQYCWLKDSSKENEISLAPASYTYKYLKESPEWINATSPKLVSFGVPGYNAEDNLIDYIPEDTMCASDAFIFMSNNINSYKSFPDIYKNIEYTYPGKNTDETYDESTVSDMEFISNIYYPKKSYNIKNYAISDDNKIINTYKSAEDVYTELYSDETSIIEWDRIPVVEKSEYLVTAQRGSNINNEIFHNFNEITSVNLAVKNISNNIVKLLVFITFKNKLIIFPLDYNIGKDADKENTNGRSIVNLNQYPISITSDDIIENIEKGYICIENIDPSDNTSLKFLNLNAIKVYKKMMYLVDNKLNMVIRYDIESLFENTVTKIDKKTYDSAFVPSSIKLLNILQGFGDSTDKIYFNNPYSIDANDSRVYIADRGNKCVKVYTPGLNYLKTLKNGFFSAHDIQAVAINPCGCEVNGKSIKPNSLWIASAYNNRLYISILSDDIVIDYGQIEDITLQSDKYTWVEEIRGLNFSGSNSNYFYINTNKKVYKFHTSKPYYPFASMTYFNQRSLANILKWRTLNYPWHELPRIYTGVEGTSSNEITWSYRPPAVAAEVLDNKCFTLINIDNIENQLEGDFIFHFGVLYDNSMIMEFIKNHEAYMTKEMTFADIPSAELNKMIKSSAMLLYREPDAYVSSLSNSAIKVYDTYEYSEKVEDDYINTLSFNKMLYAMVFNLLRIKNDLIGHFKAATNLDNVIVYDNLVLDDYFNNLQIGNDADYFIHDNELTTIIINRTLENIFDLQKKIINHMQTTFMASQSWVNNVSRII